MPDKSQNGWNEYSKLVLKELETLSDGIDILKVELQEVRQELTKMHAREDKVDELRSWKERVDDVASPTQLKELVESVEDLKTFRTKAITVFAVVQFGMAVAMWIIKAI
jgi:NifB/MoaA-like Fe-S oxidoreductase|tara:strand:+ start:426 stop:752 length:327 start_codon:yes stop_codon:yes gene_type:complete